MIFGKVERRRTGRTSSKVLTKSAKIVALWRVLTQSPVATKNDPRHLAVSALCKSICEARHAADYYIEE